MVGTLSYRRRKGAELEENLTEIDKDNNYEDLSESGQTVPPCRISPEEASCRTQKLQEADKVIPVRSEIGGRRQHGEINVARGKGGTDALGIYEATLGFLPQATQGRLVGAGLVGNGIFNNNLPLKYTSNCLYPRFHSS